MTSRYVPQLLLALGLALVLQPRPSCGAASVQLDATPVHAGGTPRYRRTVDSPSTIQSLVDHAIATGAKHLSIPPGDYFFNDTRSDFQVHGAQGLEIVRGLVPIFR